MEHPNWGQFSGGIAVVTIGVVLILSPDPWNPFGPALIFLGLFLMFFSLRPTWQSMPWYEQHQARKRHEEQRRKSQEERERLEREWRPWAEPWVEFYCTAGLMLAALNRLHMAVQDGEKPPDDPECWQEILLLARRAMKEARPLHPQDRAIAERYLPHFLELAEDRRDPNAEATRRIDFHKYLFEREANHYRKIRSNLGLPSAAEVEKRRGSTPPEVPPPTTAG